jgi:hypothetical protein
MNDPQQPTTLAASTLPPFASAGLPRIWEQDIVIDCDTNNTDEWNRKPASRPTHDVRAPFASTVPPGNRAGHSYTDTSNRGPGNRAGHSYTDTSSASRNRELIDRELIQRAVHECVHQPTDVPYLEQLMNSPQWKRDVDYTMSEKSFSEAGPGLGRIDKGALGDKSFRIIRTFVRDQDGTFHDPDLEENAPTVHAFIKILLEVYDLTDVAFQKMLEQGFHCDPHARYADDGKECHVLLTVNGNHALGFSTSPKIPTLDDRYTTWESKSENNKTIKGCGSNKVKTGNLNDILVVRREGRTPLQVVKQSILGGTKTNAPNIILHAGLAIPAIPGEPDCHWITSQTLCDILRERKREFRDSDSDGAIVSTCMLGNFLGTPKAAAKAMESAAEHVCQMLQANHETHKYVPVPIHRRTLARFEDLLTQRKISDLSFRQTGYMSKAWSDRHYIRCVEGGGCQRGLMTGTKKIAHTKAIVEVVVTFLFFLTYPTAV